jgi:hypothetical protein
MYMFLFLLFVIAMILIIAMAEFPKLKTLVLAFLKPVTWIISLVKFIVSVFSKKTPPAPVVDPPATPPAAT